MFEQTPTAGLDSALTRVRVVAEIGTSWNSSIKVATEMLHRSKDSGADYVKTQMFRSEKLGYDVELTKKLKKVEPTLEQLKELKRIALQTGIGFFVTPMKEIRILKQLVKALDPPLIKIREADSRNDAFVNAAVKTGKPLLISVDPKKGPYFKPCDNSHLLYAIPRYPPRTADFSHRWAGTHDGFSSHFPHISFLRIAIREARSMGREVYWVEAHTVLSHDYPCLDRRVSIDFDELAQVASYGHRER